MILKKQTIWRFKPRFCEIDRHGHVHNSFYSVYIEEAIINFCEINGLLDSKLFLDSAPTFLVHSFSIRFFLSLKLNDFAIVETKLSGFTKTGIEFSSTILLDTNTIIAKAQVIWVSFCNNKQSKKDFTEIMLKNLHILNT